MTKIYIDEKNNHLYKINKENTKLFRFDLNSDEIDYNSQVEVSELTYPLYVQIQKSLSTELKTLKVKRVDCSPLIVLRKKQKAYKINYQRAVLECYENRNGKWLFSTHVTHLEQELYNELQTHFKSNLQELNLQIK